MGADDDGGVGNELAPQNSMLVDEFARRICELLKSPGNRVVWFLGAGCSISSGIPSAADLVRQWMPRLKNRVEGDKADWEEWASRRFPGGSAEPGGESQPAWNPDDPAGLYGHVIEQLFLTDKERQQEVERITAKRDPAVGYALLALLMGEQTLGDRANVALTTNFDDLPTDALYLVTRQKPLVVMHDSLARFARQSPSRPLIVKLHGDARLEPRNTKDQTAEIDGELTDAVHRLLDDAALVVCGYGGNDESIATLLGNAPASAFDLGVYWVGERLPEGRIRTFLADCQSLVHVKHQDFDTLMISLADELDLRLPPFDRLQDLHKGWTQALSRREQADEEDERTRQPAKRFRTQLDALRLAREAHALKANDPDRAETLYRQAIDADPSNAANLGSYAIFLKNVRGDHDQAETLYRQAIDADPTNADVLGSYAIFLTDVRGDHARAETLSRQAIDADPTNADNLGNYAELLIYLGRDEDAVQVVDQALRVEPDESTKAVLLLFLHALDGQGFIAAGRDLRRLLEAGTRHLAWDLSRIVDRANADGDPRLDYLTVLTEAIRDRRPLADLDPFEEWEALA